MTDETPGRPPIIIVRDEHADLCETAASGSGKTDPQVMAMAEQLARASREIVTTLNDPHAAANRRAWKNITRPVDADPLWGNK